jgi:hypothetical protein
LQFFEDYDVFSLCTALPRDGISFPAVRQLRLTSLRLLWYSMPVEPTTHGTALPLSTTKFFHGGAVLLLHTERYHTFYVLDFSTHASRAEHRASFALSSLHTYIRTYADDFLLGTELFAIRAPPHNPTLSPPGLQIYDVAHGFCWKKFEKTKGDHDEVRCTPRGHHPQCHLR